MNLAQLKQLMAMKKWQLVVKATAMGISTKGKKKAIIAHDLCEAMEAQQQRDWDTISGRKK